MFTFWAELITLIMMITGGDSIELEMMPNDNDNIHTT